MTRILVTGATGSLGSALARRLIELGADVVVLRLPGTPPGGLAGYAGRFEERAGDVTEPDSLRQAMKGIDLVFHLAGVAVPLNRLHRQMYRVNVTGAANVARAAAQAGVRRLVHTSTIAAVGYPPAGEVADESFDVDRSVVRNSYMLTKRAGEERVFGIGAALGLDVVVVNPAAVLAPYSHLRYGWAGLVDLARRGRLRVYPPGGVAVCADGELVEGQLAAMERGAAGRRYILATANLSYRELFTLACQVVGVPPPRRGVPAALVRAAGRMGSLAATLRAESPLLVPENAELAVRTFVYDPARSRRELGVAPGDPAASIARINDWLGKEGSRAVDRPTR
jgi:nucleoside-diphosphate-sugar epimerase